MLKEYNFLAKKQNQNRSFLRNRINRLLIEIRNLRIDVIYCVIYASVF